jgi:hypothetical protein
MLKIILKASLCVILFFVKGETLDNPSVHNCAAYLCSEHLDAAIEYFRGNCEGDFGGFISNTKPTLSSKASRVNVRSSVLYPQSDSISVSAYVSRMGLFIVTVFLGSFILGIFLAVL